MRDTFIFYRSFYEAVRELDAEDQNAVFTAICEYSLNGKKVVLEGMPKAIFTLIEPFLKTNNSRYENGKKGGRPKTKPKPKDNQNETKAKPNKDKDKDIYKKRNIKKKVRRMPKEDELTHEDFVEISKKYHYSVSFVKKQWEALYNYCHSSGNGYVDFKAALRNFVNRAIDDDLKRNGGVDPRTIEFR